MAALPASRDAAPSPTGESRALDAALESIEVSLTLLQRAVLAGAMPEVEAQSAALHRQLASSVVTFMQAAQDGALSAAQRRQLGHASARVAAQRESLARATAALDRAMDVLIDTAPSQPGALYAAHGGPGPRTLGSVAKA